MPATLTEESEPTNVLYYGDGGSGKTTNLMAAAAHGRIWVINAESGVKGGALRRVAAELGIEIPIQNIEIFPDPSQGEELSYDGIEMEWKRIREALHEDPNAYFGVFWDSVTEVQAAMKDLEVKRSNEKAARRGIDRDPFVVDQDNWRTVNEQCRSLIRKFRDLPCHFGASALQRREQDNSGKVTYRPSTTPGLQDDIIGWFDVICHVDTMQVGEDEIFMGAFRKEVLYSAKDRFKALPKRLVNPTMPRVHAYIEGELTVDTDEMMQDLRRRIDAQTE